MVKAWPQAIGDHLGTWRQARDSAAQDRWPSARVRHATCGGHPELRADRASFKRPFKGLSPLRNGLGS